MRGLTAVLFLFFHSQTLAAVAIGENVTWAESAADPVLPIDAVPDTSASDPEEDGGIEVPLRRIEYRISEDTIERFRTRVFRYTSEDSVRDYGNIPVWYNAASDNVEIRRAAVIDSGGAVHVVDPATVQILPGDTTSIFSDSKYALLPLAGLDVGSNAVIEDYRITDRRKTIAPWGAVVTEAFRVPQRRLEIVVRWTAPELEPAWSEEADRLACVRAGEMGVDCVATDIPAYDSDPNVYWEDVLPGLTIAERNSWETIRAWYAGLFEPALSSDPSVVRTAAQLTESLDSELEKLEAIHSFVATKIRYVGLEHGAFAFVPRRSDLTLSRRYGDCKDKTALLIDMLKHAGIEMSPVLVSTERRDPGKLLLPSGVYFDHLIACGSLSNGAEYCLDATDPYSGVSTLSNWIQGAVALPIDAAGGPTTLPAEMHRWTLSEDLELTFGDQGALDEKSVVEYSGAYGSMIRGILASKTTSERQQWATDDYHNTVSSSVDPEFRFEGIDDLNDGVRISWDTRYEDAFPQDSDLSYSEDQYWLDQLIASLSTKNRFFEYRFSGLSYSQTTTISVSDHWHISHMGPEIDMQGPYGSMLREHDIDEQKAVVRTAVEMPAAVISVAELDKFRAFLELLRRENSIGIEALFKQAD